jgi:hypothetical protein
MGFRQPHARQEIIPITEQATGPLRRRRIKGLTIRTTVPNPGKATTTLHVTQCSGRMRRLPPVRHRARLESSMTSLRPLHRCGPYNLEVVACDIFATSNSLKSHVARNLKSPFSNIHAIPFKLYPHTRPTTVKIALVSPRNSRTDLHRQTGTRRSQDRIAPQLHQQPHRSTDPRG